MDLFIRHGHSEEGAYDAKGRYIPSSDEVTAYQAARIPWAHFVVYGYYALAVLGGMLFLAIVLNINWKVRVRYGTRPPGYRRAAALLRLATYPRLRPGLVLDWFWTVGPLGPNILLFTGLVVASCLCWIPKYYYYAPFYGSAPLFLRSEWIAMATMPFVYVLGSKRNLISLLTGVSHAKLQVLHQGAALNFFYMSLVHSIAACVRANREIGLVKTVQTDDIYVSGFVALAPLCVLVVGGLPPLRYTYELFWYCHATMAVFFLAALFWHGYGLLDNNAYCAATIILFLGAGLYRLGAMLINNATLHAATVSLADEHILRIAIPTAMRWKAGQHVFLRFPAVRPFESHPFTIATPCPDGERPMTFLVRTKRGFTRALTATGGGQFKVLVDGPYGHAADDLAAFDHVLVYIGGGGISWGIGVLQALCPGPDLSLVFAVPEYSALAWFQDELAVLQNQGVKVTIYITGNDRTTSTLENKAGTVNLTPPDSPKEHAQPAYGRPDLPALCRQEIYARTGTIAVCGCGPASLLADVANAVSRAEVDILTGRLEGVDELYLVTEAYEW